MYTTLIKFYDNACPYWPFVKEIVECYEKAELLYDTLADRISHIDAMWEKYYQDLNKAKELLTKRDAYRMYYDHYDLKLEKMVDLRTERHLKGLKEEEKDILLFERNEAKFKEAAENYVKCSLVAYSYMSEMIDMRYKYVNPIIMQVFYII
jgi:hypothetical protein